MLRKSLFVGIVVVLLAQYLVPSFSAFADGSNLVLNPGLETENPAGTPQSWSTGNFGANNATFTYPVAGPTGATDKAAEVSITTYTDGDAKWYFADVPVVPGHEYSFSNWYLSDVTTSVLVRFTLTGGIYQYVNIGAPDISTGWTQFNKTFVAPDNSVSATVFHTLSKVGTLRVDAFDFHEVVAAAPSATEAFSEGMISLSFDDGWTTQYENALPIINAAGIKSTFFIITNPVSTATLPENLTSEDPGSTTTTWSTLPTNIVAGGVYSFSDSFTATGPGTLKRVYTLTDGITQIENTLSSFTGTGTPETFTTNQFIVPLNQNIAKVHFIRSLTGAGELTENSFFLKDERTYIRSQEVLALQNQGHEIGAHTQTHPDLAQLADDAAQAEITGSRNYLLSVGATPVNVFAYPYGSYNNSVKQDVLNAGFVAGRSIDVGYNLRTSDPYALKAVDADIPLSMSEIKARIDTALANKTWLILFFHNVDTTNGDVTISPTALKEITDYIKAKNARTVTIGEGVNIMKMATPGTPTATPVAGNFTGTASVTLASTDSTSIRYTVDGSTPTCTTGTIYSSAISLSATTTVKAIGCNTEFSSAVSTFEYTLTTTPVPPPSGGGSSGGGVGAVHTSQSSAPSDSGSTSGNGSGQVLGDSTTAPTAPTTPSIVEPLLKYGQILGLATCNEMLPHDLWYGIRKNNVAEVKALQNFLNKHQNAKIPVTGYYGTMTRAAVKNFQVKNKEIILNPFKLRAANGNVTGVTRETLNKLQCPS